MENPSQLASGFERRTFPLSEVQLESRSGAPERIRGHSAVFNSLSENMGFFKERIQPGAFAGAIQGDVRALINHDPGLLLGRTKSGTLRLKEDRSGLYEEIDPPDTQYARDLMTVIKRGDIDQQSFTMVGARDLWHVENGTQIRTVVGMRQLLDVSPVTYAAYNATDVQVRSLVQEAGLDFEGLAAAMVKQFRGLNLSKADRDILSRATDRLPVLHGGDEGQAPPAPEAKPSSPQAWWLNLHRRRVALAAKTIKPT